MLQQGGADPDDVVIVKVKYQVQMQDYKLFCKDMDLTPQMERVYIEGLGRVAPGQGAYEKFILAKKKAGNLPTLYSQEIILLLQDPKTCLRQPNMRKISLISSMFFYKNIDVRTANDINKAIADGLSYAPEISDRLRFIGSTQLRNTELRKELTKAFDQDLRAMYTGRNEEYYKMWSKNSQASSLSRLSQIILPPQICQSKCRIWISSSRHWHG